MILILKKDLQFPNWWKKGDRFYLDDETAWVYGMEKVNEKWVCNENPLRKGLSGQINMMLIYAPKFFKIIKEQQ